GHTPVVNVLDLLIVVAAAFAAVGGYRLGFVTRASSWIGMGVGLFVGARILPDVLEWIEGAGQTQLLLAAAGVLIGGAFLGQAIGLLLGSRVHLALPVGS